MLFACRLAVAGALLSLALTGCDSSNSDSAKQRQPTSSGTAPSASLSAPLSSPATSAPASSAPATSAPTSSAPTSSMARPSPSAINVGASLCSGADLAQNTADAYMGALSANDAQQAMACVLPNTVPTALTRSLLSHATTTAAYLPRDGVNGPAVFGYRGSGKMIDVTVSKQPNGQFWVTEVAVRNG